MHYKLYGALGRLAGFPLGRGKREFLTAALRQASACAGARLMILRLPESLGDPIVVRYPHGSVWPPKKLVETWHAQVLRTAKPLSFNGSPRMSNGIALPVFATDGSCGSIIAFPVAQTAFASEQCAVMSTLVQGALARIEVAEIRRQSFALTTAEAHERLARDLHDGPLQMLTGLLLHLRTDGVAAKGDAGGAVTESVAMLRKAISEMRATIRRLRTSQQSSALEDRVREALLRLQHQQGVTWNLQWKVPEGLLAPAAADEVFHVVNEALANVYRHSMAKRVDVLARVRGNALEVMIRDDGVGFDVSRALRRDIRTLSFGLVSMRERMAEIGGLLALRSHAGKGTRVKLTVPVDVSPRRSAQDAP